MLNDLRKSFLRGLKGEQSRKFQIPAKIRSCGNCTDIP